MTQEEHDILIENNIMLKQILAYIYQNEGPNNDLQDFSMNILANLISEKISSK